MVYMFTHNVDHLKIIYMIIMFYYDLQAKPEACIFWINYEDLKFLMDLHEFLAL